MKVEKVDILVADIIGKDQKRRLSLTRSVET